MATVEPLAAYHWTPQPAAEALIHELVAAFLQRSQFAAQLRDKMLYEAGVRLVDMVDHLRLPATPQMHSRLVAAGFRPRAATAAP